MYICKTPREGRGEEMANNSISGGLDYNIDNLEERKKKVEQLIKTNEVELVNYFDDYYNPSLTQSARLSENDPMCKQLERIADYLLYADNKEKQKDNYGEELDIVNSSDEDKNKKKELLTENIALAQEGSNKVHQHKLYRKVKVTNEDREQYPELRDTGELIKRLKKMIDTGVDSNGNPIGEEAMKKIRWYLIDIRKDEVAMKEMLKGYIRFKRLSPEGGEDNYSGFSFDNVNHVRAILDNYSELKQSSFDDTHGDLKIILEVFEEIVDRADLEEYLFDVIIMKIDGLSRREIVKNIREGHDLDLSESRISQITKNVIPEIIVETYKKSYEDWVYTFVIKGIYKTCSKCGVTKLADSKYFSPHKKGKYGLHSYCRSCR